MTTRGCCRVGALVAALAGGACYDDVKVVQGTVTAVDPSATRLEVQDERAPTAGAAYHLARPVAVAKGDLVRVAFRERADGRQVVRVMNLTRNRAKAAGDKH